MHKHTHAHAPANSVAFDSSFDTKTADGDDNVEVICVMFNGFIQCMHSTQSHMAFAENRENREHALSSNMQL